MAVKVGHNGLVKLGTATVAYIDSWSMDGNIDAIEVSAFGDKNRKYQYGLKNVTAQISGTFDSTNASQTSIRGTFMSTAASSTVTLRLYAESVGGSTEGFTGSAVLTNISVGAAVGDKISFSASAQYSGGVASF
jgi:hypothetical protein